MRRLLCFCLLTVAFFPLSAIDSYTKDILVSEIEEVSAPVVDGDYIIFTATDNARHVGIAFDFENFKTIHSFEKLTRKDLDEEVTTSLYFYILEVPKSIQYVSYRLVIDGLWTIDPTNPLQWFDTRANLTLSRVEIFREVEPATSIPTKNKVHFVYQGEPGLQIRLGGSFTNWDSSIYVMKETSPGFYELELSLPKGTYYYAFYDGITSFIDSSNPERTYSVDGKAASVITVE
ncbi:MAG: isoamylase [Spirochaetaceae bacterium]|nr:isoamylase [Spirochaetaceae bacterium]